LHDAALVGAELDFLVDRDFAVRAGRRDRARTLQ
jgi:hypothetical protein